MNKQTKWYFIVMNYAVPNKKVLTVQLTPEFNNMLDACGYALMYADDISAKMSICAKMLDLKIEFCSIHLAIRCGNEVEILNVNIAGYSNIDKHNLN